MTIPTRRRVGLLLGGLVLGTLVVLTPSEVAHAEDPCLSEVVTGATILNPGSRCDDVSPPETAFTGASVRANANGYIAVNDLQISFAGSYADADADPISYECQLYKTAEAPAAWTACSSPRDLSDLEDTTDTPWTFRVRAVDGNDRAITATAGGGPFQPTPAATDLPDLDETPAAVSFYVDTTTPNTFVFDGPYDQVTPDYPMLEQRALAVEITSNEDDARFFCTIDAKPVPCSGGQAVFPRLKPGNQALRVSSVDLAGNTDPSPTYTPFSVPTNLGTRFGKGWTKVKSTGGYFAYDYLAATKPGALLRLKASRATEMRLIAPLGPALGQLEIQVGAQQPWVPLRQVASTDQAFAVVYQRFFGRKFSGQVSIRAARASASRPAVVDAVLLH